MGYRVGYQCFANHEQAQDYLLSQQLPVITEQGQLIRPVKQGNDWYLNGQKVYLSFPECEISEQIVFGAMLFAPFITLALLVFCINEIKKLVRSIN